MNNRFSEFLKSGVYLPLIFISLVFFLFSSLCLIHPTKARAAKTKEECQECCDRKYDDEYYAERCRLECHRDTEHCTAAPEKRKKPEVKPKKKKKRPKRAKRRKPKKKKTITLRFPNPLNIIPGEEWRTAVELVVLNGITSRHPKFVQAVERVEKILINFRVNNPQGGELPTKALERAIVKYK
jgi:hypothetical protein